MAVTTEVSRERLIFFFKQVYSRAYWNSQKEGSLIRRWFDRVKELIMGKANFDELKDQFENIVVLLTQLARFSDTESAELDRIEQEIRDILKTEPKNHELRVEFNALAEVSRRAQDHKAELNSLMNHVHHLSIALRDRSLTKEAQDERLDRIFFGGQDGDLNFRGIYPLLTDLESTLMNEAHLLEIQ